MSENKQEVEKAQTEQLKRRLQALFEHCVEKTMQKWEYAIDFDKNEAGNYKEKETNMLFALWMSGHFQGVVDYAFTKGEIDL